MRPATASFSPSNEVAKQEVRDPRFEPTPESPAWLAAMGEADLEAERWLEQEAGT